MLNDDLNTVEEAGADAPTAATGDSERQRLIAAAVGAWKGQLVDLGGRNTLLYYRDLKQGTLDLSNADSDAVEALLARRTVALSRLVPDPETLTTAAKRARTVRAKATENYEERGLRTLYLAWGMATWTNSRGTATPAAPLLLAELSLTARGGAAEDFDLTLSDDWDFNPTLLHLLEVDFGISLDGEKLDDLADSGGLDAVIEKVSAATSAIPGWDVTDRIVVGNFSYAKLPLVRDLELALESGELYANDLLAAIAGHPGARDALRERHPDISINEPDVMPPQDEFLVLDADASQSFVINAAVGGADLVIEGPPGTGKSQTIANLIATLAARGKRVLFVAEKRAAIDAVLDRLGHVGLDGIVLDLHGGVSSRRALAQELAKTLAAASSAPLPNVTDTQARLVRRRQELLVHNEALHRQREPWGISMYEAQAGAVTIDDTVRVDARFVGSVLQTLTAETFAQATVELDRFVSLGGLQLRAGIGPWATALHAGSITAAEHAQAVQQALTQLSSSTLPNAEQWISYVCTSCGLRSPDTVSAWAQTLDLIDEVAATLTVFEPDIFHDADGRSLEAICDAMESAARSGPGGFGARHFNGAARSARKQLRTLWKANKPSVRELYGAAAAALQQRRRWANFAIDGTAPRVPEQLAGARGSFQQTMAELDNLGGWLGRNDLATLPLTQLIPLLQSLSGDQATLSRLPELYRLYQALRRYGLDEFLAEISVRQLSPDQAVAALRFAWCTSITDLLSMTDPALAAFDSSVQDRVVRDFCDADRAHIRSGPERVRRAVAEHAVRAQDEHRDQADIVAQEARKQRRHRPVRELFQMAPDVLTALKPCWVMSPLVVAQLLPPVACFDVVIFDEASQITPADAVGALLRANRAIVAGDTKQLPPTRFFASTTAADNGEADDEMALTRDMESVLDVMGALLPPPKGTRTLRWHYRSRDERLIAFSNAQASLYDWSLTTFPGVAGDDCISHELIDRGVSADGESSDEEVRRVVDLILEHARNRPHESLGVIAMGIKHADRISETLRRARAEEPDLDDYFDLGPEGRTYPEPVFVKNLERVQGDERDAIILSVGYGKTPDGRMLYRFGPLNNDGGERRLNVAITRARQRMTVVSSFESADMDPNRLNKEGARMLMRYLEYAESGGADLGNVAKEKPDLNPFERDVRDKLISAGIPLVPQFGCSGYYIDYAAQHPTKPGRMVLAIECDGASYHSSETARDRDRLRQEHLERLGWRFHRIWSTDWFRHREREIQRVRAAYDAAVLAADDPPSAVAVAPPAPDAEISAVATRGPRPAIPRYPSIDDYSDAQLVQLIRWINSDTLLRTQDALIGEAMRELGFARRGSRIVARLSAAIAAAR